jgi:hypothetical protein
VQLVHARLAVGSPRNGLQPRASGELHTDTAVVWWAAWLSHSVGARMDPPTTHASLAERDDIEVGVSIGRREATVRVASFVTA